MCAYDSESIKNLDLAPLLSTLYDSGVLSVSTALGSTA
jgi:hypothetical protein